MNSKIELSQISLNGNICEVKWNDDHVSRFHAKWLRFNCHCERCWPRYPGDYHLDITAFPRRLVMKNASILKDGEEINLQYENELYKNHVTIQPADWLRSKCYCDVCLQRKISERDVITQNMSRKPGTDSFPTIDFQNIVDDSDRGIFKLLKNVIDSGLCLVKNVPIENEMLLEVTEKISYVEQSTYGKIFDVVDIDKENVAYTSLKLPLHQDQPQYEISPGIQFLHAIRFDSCVVGGESTISDAFEAAQALKEEFPEDFQTLVEVPAIFDTIDFKRKNTVCLEHQKPIIRLDYFGKIIGVNWNPHIIAAPQVHEKDVDRFYDAYVKMTEVIRREESQFRFRLQPGDMVVFNNRRMLHAREAFESNGGVRHLQGTYVKLDEFRSKYMTLAKKLNIDVIPPKVGNNSSF